MLMLPDVCTVRCMVPVTLANGCLVLQFSCLRTIRFDSIADCTADEQQYLNHATLRFCVWLHCQYMAANGCSSSIVLDAVSFASQY